MNLMSSMANTLVGSAMAMVRVAPERESGSTWYFRAVSAGMILMMAGSTSKWSRSIDGTPYWRESRLVISSSLTNPRLTKAFADLAPAPLRVVQGVLELLRRNHVLLQQQLSEPDGHADTSGRCLDPR